MFTQSLLALNSNSYLNYLITYLNGLKKKNQFIIITVSHFVTFLSSNFLKFEYGVYRYIFDLLESDNFEIIKIDCCYGSENFANETYKEILNNL
jgi:hypothetical protein